MPFYKSDRDRYIAHLGWTNDFCGVYRVEQ